MLEADYLRRETRFSPDAPSPTALGARLQATALQGWYALHNCATLIATEVTVAHPDQVWVTDITYIRTYEGWLYLTVVIDPYSRAVVGWSMKSDTPLTDSLIQLFAQIFQEPEEDWIGAP